MEGQCFDGLSFNTRQYRSKQSGGDSLRCSDLCDSFFSDSRGIDKYLGVETHLQVAPQTDVRSKILMLPGILQQALKNHRHGFWEKLGGHSLHKSSSETLTFTILYCVVPFSVNF